MEQQPLCQEFFESFPNSHTAEHRAPGTVANEHEKAESKKKLEAGSRKN